jgi:hypothetical protein
VYGQQVKIHMGAQMESMGVNEKKKKRRKERKE